jgi:uncharacterized FlaG/YvyC family protein
VSKTSQISPARQIPTAQNGNIASGGNTEDLDPNLLISREKLEEVVVQMQDYTQRVNRSLSFSVDRDSGRYVVKVLDADTNETIRQFPSEEILRLISYLKEESVEEDVSTGLLIREQV